MEKKKDEMPDWLAIPLIGIGLAIWYASESPENYQQVMTWLATASSVIKWMSQTTDGSQVATSGVSNLRALAIIVVMGAIIAGAIYVIIELSHRNNSGRGSIDSTMPGMKIKRNRGWLPRGFPKDICSIVEDVLTVRGGLAEDKGPNFWVERSNCAATPLYWSLAIDYAPGATPEKLGGMINNINDRLIRKDVDADVMVDYRPLSIIINNPKPPTFTLADYWKMIAALPQNELLCAGSVIVEGNKMVLCRQKLEGEGSGTLIAGRSSAGKTQFAMSTLLSMCMANSPERLSLFIADIKKVDTIHLAAIPHLAAPIATEVSDVAAILAAMVTEMMRRSQVSDVDRSWEDNAIAIYIDELAELLKTASDRKAEIVESINSLARTGRALGMIVIAATQRVVEVETAAFANLSRRCVLKSQKIADSNHAVGASGTAGHKLPVGAVSIHDAGDSDGELTRGLFVGSTKNGFDKTVAPFIADIRKRWDGHKPINLAIGHKPVTSRPGVIVSDNPKFPITVIKVSDMIRAEEANTDNIAMEHLADVVDQWGIDVVNGWIEAAIDGSLSANAIRKATGRNNDYAKSLRNRIETSVQGVLNTHDLESSE